MADKPPLKLLSPQEWESFIDDFQYGGVRREKWLAAYSIAPSLVDQALSSLLRREFPIKLAVVLFLEEFLSADPLPVDSDCLRRLVDALRSLLHPPADGVAVSPSLKEQMMVSVTSILISLEAGLDPDFVRALESLVESLLIVVNRPNHSSDRQLRVIACECLRELETAFPSLLSDIAGHLWSLCQNERTHASQSYILLFTSVIRNIVEEKVSVSILNNSVPLVPFSVPQNLLRNEGSSAVLNLKELRRALAFLLEWPQVLTPCGMMEFVRMIIPVASALELPASMLKVQFFGMVYSMDPISIHVVLMMHSQFLDAFDGQEGEIARRLMLVSTETQLPLVFRLLALHWFFGFGELMLRKGDGKKTKLFVEMGSKFCPNVFDPLALKAMKLDMLAFCSVCRDIVDSDNGIDGDMGTGKSVVKLFQDCLVSVSAFKWLPAESTETAVAFRAFYRFLIGASSHSDNDPSTTTTLMDSTVFRAVQEMLVDVVFECQRLVPVIVALVDRLLSCKKHIWLGESLLQTFDERLLVKVKIDYKLVSCFALFDRIAENSTIPPRQLLELLTKLIIFLVEKHGLNAGLKTWSQGSRVLGICRTLLMHHSSSKLFLRLSRLLSFVCLYFPDLEVRDNARVFLRMLICVPGKKLRNMLNLGDQLLGISPSPPSSFFSVQSPRSTHNVKKPSNLASYIHLQRLTPLLVKQSWSLSLSSFFNETNKPVFFQDIKDSEPIIEIEESEIEGSSSNIQIVPESKRINKPPEPLRVMDSKIAEILGRLRRHFSSVPDFRHTTGLKVKIPCNLRFESEPLNSMLGVDSDSDSDSLPAIYATILKFSSSAPYGSIPSSRIPFLLGEPPSSNYNSVPVGPLDIVLVENGSREEDKRFQAHVTIELEPREPTPGLVDVSIETNAENGMIVRGQLHSITVGIEDMFLKAIVPNDVEEDETPGYYVDLFNALWEACGTSSNTGSETFPLKGGKGVAAISGTRSVKLIEIPVSSLVRSVERSLAPYVVSVIGEPLVSLVKDRGIVRDVVWDIEVSSDDDNDDDTPLHLTYTEDQSERDGVIGIGKRHLGSILVLIFLPPKFHLLFEMEVSDLSTLVRIRTDHWPCLAYIDDYLEALFLA